MKRLREGDKVLVTDPDPRCFGCMGYVLAFRPDGDITVRLDKFWIPTIHSPEHVERVTKEDE